MEKRPLMNELTQGRDLANQLKGHLDQTLSAAQTCEFLVERILSSYEKALSMLNNPFDEAPAAADSYSPNHCTTSTKKRKTMDKWSEQVKVCSGNMVEAPLNDGYSWRKYGQKDILGASHPRAYYRCTHRNVQGCLATKQVQRSDEDSSVFEVSYRGRHTCIQATQLSKALDKKPPKKEEEEEKKCMDRAFSFNFKATYKGGEEGLFPCFSFASTPIETEKLENLFCDFNPNLQTSDSDLSDVINSTPNSVTNSPFGGCDLNLDLDFDHVDFDVADSEMFV
ncbi:putative transcription factor WRKY family [Helianthus anomalus]